MKLSIEFDKEEDGRWIAEIPELPGVMVYGSSKKEAQKSAKALASLVLRDGNRDILRKVKKALDITK